MCSKLGNIEVKQPVQGIPVAATILSNKPLCWSEDNVISLLTNLGFCLFDLNINPYGDQAGLLFDRVYISTPETQHPYILAGPPLVKLANSMNSDDRHLLMLDATLTAAHRALLSVSNANKSNQNGGGNSQGVDVNHLSYSKAVWSSKGATNRDECLLCLATFDHQLRIVGRIGTQWNMLFDLTDLWGQYPSNEGLEVFEEYQSTIGAEEHHCFIAKTQFLGVSEILWTHPITNVEGERFSVLLLATTSSHLALIKIPQYGDGKPFEPSILDCFSLDSSLGKISTLEWTPVNTNEGFLCVGTIKGFIQIYFLSLNTKYMKLLHTFENCIVGMRINHLRLHCLNPKKDQYMLFVGKHNILIAYLLVASPLNVKNIASTHSLLRYYHISGIQVIDPSLIYVSTKDGVIKQFEVSYNYNTESISFAKEEVLFSSRDKAFYNGFCFSPNFAFFAILECVSVPYDHLQLREPTVINIFQGNTFKTVSKHLLKDTSATLSQQIDVFESLRLLTFRDEIICFPSITSQEIQSLGNKLKKVYLWFTAINFHFISRKGLSDESKTQEELRDALEISILTDYVLEVFSSSNKEPFPNDESHKLSLVLMSTFLQQNNQSHPFIKKIKIQFKNETSSPKENCIVCSAAVEFTSIKSASCANGHRMPRCWRSLLSTSPIFRCSVCQLFYHPKASIWYGEVARTCLICTRILQLRVRRRKIEATL